MDNGDRPDNGGEGHRKERFGSGREVEEREVGFMEGRKETTTKEIEKWKEGAYPKVLGAPPVCLLKDDAMRTAQSQTFPAWVLALFLAASPSPGIASGHPRQGRERSLHYGKSASRVVP
jgi:hypothetical protein